MTRVAFANLARVQYSTQGEVTLVGAVDPDGIQMLAGFCGLLSSGTTGDGCSTYGRLTGIDTPGLAIGDILGKTVTGVQSGAVLDLSGYTLECTGTFLGLNVTMYRKGATCVGAVSLGKYFDAGLSGSTVPGGFSWCTNDAADDPVFTVGEQVTIN